MAWPKQIDSMTASAIMTNNNNCWLKIYKGFINIFIVINSPKIKWWKYLANLEFTTPPPLFRRSDSNPLEVQQLYMYT